MCYGASFAATNFYITDFLTRVKGFTSDQAGTLLMVSGAVGFLFYMLGGALGERWGRREVLIVTAPLVAPLNLIFLIVQPAALVAIVYFLIYQATNSTWSGAGYAYQRRELSDPCARHGGRLSERDDGWRVSHRVSTVDRP